MVNPIPEGKTLSDMLQNQEPVKTFRWWKKLLGEKGYMISNMEDLETTIRGFTPQEEALGEFIHFVDGEECCAHNGNAFDHIILRGALKKYGYPNPPFLDSLKMIRKKFDFDKNNLGYLYTHLFHETFRAHHALDDALALQRIVERCASLRGVEVEDLWDRFVPLESIRGIGKATKHKLMRSGIESAEDLFEWVKEHTPEEWKEEFSHLHRYKKLGKHLYGKRW